jgi:uncharacterized membrane protein|tara:strand:+ start:204 stop:596 length:393 start_codon:yes stop_codon:yes gene_type:complete
MPTEFKFLGNNMEKISSYYGAFLIIWGFAVSSLSNSESLTSLIPTFLGILILVFALFALFIPSKKKLFMHIVVMFGLITFIGGLDLFRNYNSLFNNFWGDLSKLMMLTTGLFFTYLCIKSFIHARKQNSK